MCGILKHIVSFIIAAFCFENLSAQTVTLSAEIVWKRHDVYLFNYDAENVPFLKFTYKNNAADSIYFPNPFKNEFEFTEYIEFNYFPGYLINYGRLTQFDVLMFLFPPFPRWADNEYVVTVAKKTEYLNYLSFLLYKKGETNNYDDIVKSKEHEILEALTVLLRMQLRLDMDSTNLQYEWFHHPDKVASMEKIIDYLLSIKDNNLFLEKLSKQTIYDNCVFLKPYESFSFEYDLTPFFLLKGSYNFIIEPPQIPKSVKREGKDVAFLQVHNGYKLFTGQLNGVDIKLNIPPFEQARVPPSRYINIFQNGN